MEICRASFILDVVGDGANSEVKLTVEGNLDTCGSVSLSHSSLLQDVKDCRKQGLKEVVLAGIGGQSKPLREAGVLHVEAAGGKVKKILCYKVDQRLGNADKILLLSLRTIRDANIDILHHMDQSLDGISSPLLFLKDKIVGRHKKKSLHGKARTAENFLKKQKGKYSRGNYSAFLLASSTPVAKGYAQQKFNGFSDHSHCLWKFDAKDLRALPPEEKEPSLNSGDRSTSNAIIRELFHSYAEHESYMSEIQLRRIADKMANEAAEQGTDGDEIMQKGGESISKFSKEALEMGAAVDEIILDKVRKVFDLNKGDDAVFWTKSGAPKIRTKFKDKPYSYELLPEYANGSKKFPTIKSMNWEGKTATAKVIRGFTSSTPVVQRCPNPRSISRLVIVPKLAPRQTKDDPDHGFRVCVNALINKCIKPDASTIPLAVDEIKKLAHCKFFLQLDGANAYWSIPVCEESMRLTAFHTPDGLYC